MMEVVKMNARTVLRSLIVMLIGLAILGCTGPHAQLKAIYLVANGGGQLSEINLKAHPEIVVVHSQQELASEAKGQAAIWIDKNAVKIVDVQWLQSEPQAFWPLFVIGYNNPYYTFGEQLRAIWIEYPFMDWKSMQLEPGFSASKLMQQTNGGYLVGYHKRATVERLLLVTNALLKGEPPPAEIP
jgi:hypothetical protein